MKITHGSGWGYCNSKGIFEVKWSNNKVKFTDLKDAKKFYESIKEDKAFWDVTRLPELIEYIEYNK